jgi:hypothetical protein
MDMVIRKLTILSFIVIWLTALSMAGCAKYLLCCPPANLLLSQAQAESISGLRMELAYDLRDSQRSSCAYKGRNGDGLYSVSLSLHRFDNGSSNEEAHRRAATKYGSVENVAGVGDSGFFTSLDNGVLLLYARKGTTGFQLHAESILPRDEARGKLIEVARLVASRL